METKKCTICKLELELALTNFTQLKNKNKAGQITTYWCSYCKNCLNNKIKLWRQNNKEQCRKYEKKYRDNHVEQEKSRGSNYKKKNKDKISNYNKVYRSQHREIRRQQEKERRQNDISFRLRKIISRSVQKAITKDCSITKYLPYSFQELKLHLEKQFESWMNWNNHGVYNPKTWKDNDSATWTWNIDHIMPQSNLLYTSMKDDNFNKCWALENLRPYSAKQNIIDGASKVRHQLINK